MNTALASQSALDQDRIATRFAALKAQKQSGLITFITAGDPDLITSAKILAGLPKKGADIIEIGMPFSDPMADGPSIQASNIRAFKAGISIRKVLDLVQGFRDHDQETPIILMGYYNPVYAYGVDSFLHDAKKAGVDGLIIVDLPPEEDSEMRLPAQKICINLIRLITPTTNNERLPKVLQGSSGFLYYVSVSGITGGKMASVAPVRKAVTKIRHHTSLPVAVGFGITTAEQAHAMADTADAVVVGSAIVNRILHNLDATGTATTSLVDDVLGFVESLAKAIHKD